MREWPLAVQVWLLGSRPLWATGSWTKAHGAFRVLTVT